MSDPDYSTWVTKQHAADAIGVTTKTVERFVQAGQIQQARWQPHGRGQTIVVYHPEDVARVAQARQQGPLAPFVVPLQDGPAHRNGHGGSTALALTPPPPPPGDDVLRMLFAAALRAVSETSQTSTSLFLTLPEAAEVSGLSETYLRRRIANGTLKAEKDRGWKIRRKDLEQL